jgi:hypothetical protein
MISSDALTDVISRKDVVKPTRSGDGGRLGAEKGDQCVPIDIPLGTLPEEGCRPLGLEQVVGPKTKSKRCINHRKLSIL